MKKALICFLLISHIYAGKLQEAASKGHLAEIKVYVHNGVDLNSKTHRGRGLTALMAAAKEGHYDVVELLLIFGADSNVVSEKFYNNTALHYAAMNGRYRIAALLLEHGADKNARGYWNYTPLDYAKDARRKKENIRRIDDFNKVVNLLS